MSASMRRMSAMTASIAALPLSGSSAHSCTYTRVPMIASVRSIQAASAACGTALASATRLHRQALRRIMGCDRTTQPGAQEREPIPPPGGLRYSAHMVTRRELLLGTAGGVLLDRALAGEAAGRAPDTPPPPPRKKPPHPRPFRPPKLQTPP